MCSPGADQHRPAPVAGRAQQHAGERLVDVARASRRRRPRRTACRRRCSSWRTSSPLTTAKTSATTVVWKSDATIVASPGRSARSAYRPERANSSDATRNANGHVLLGLLAGDRARSHASAHGLQAQRREDREEDRGEVERQQRRTRRAAAQGAPAQQEAQRRAGAWTARPRHRATEHGQRARGPAVRAGVRCLDVVTSPAPNGRGWQM